MFSFPIQYNSPIFRPPSEADSLLIQLTLGCSHNKCAFCSMYRSKKYTERSFEEIKKDIWNAKKYYEEYHSAPRRIFLCDGDALAASFELIVKVLDEINSAFPSVNRIGIYATARNVLEKSSEELKILSDKKLGIAYLGLESGCDEVLKKIVKGNSASEMIDASDKLRASGWKISVIAMLGLGGKEMTESHCKETAKVVARISPNFFSFLSTTPIPDTPYFKMIEKGAISLLTTKELLTEMKVIIDEIKKCHDSIQNEIVKRESIIFRANHVSNQFPLQGILPRDCDKLSDLIGQWIDDCPDGIYPDIDPSRL